MKQFVSAFFLCLAASLWSQPPVQWANRFLPNCTDSFQVSDQPGLDADGNAYYGGYSYFRLRAGSDTLRSPDLINAFLMKRDSLGKLVWTIGMGGNSNNCYDVIRVVQTDDSGNVVVSGMLCGNQVMINNATVNLPGKSMDMFCAKFTAAGQLMWAKRFANKVNVYLYFGTKDGAGNYYYSCFSHCDTTFLDNDTLVGAGHFIMKMNAAGQVLWAKPVPGYYNMRGPCLKSDLSGNLYMIHSMGKDTDYIQGQMLVNPNPSSLELYIAKMNSSGQLQWAKTIAGNKSDYFSYLTIDSNNNVWFSGCFKSTSLQLDNVVLQNSSPASATSDMFIYKVDGAGNVLSGKRFGSPGGETPWDLLSDTLGNVYMCGITNSDTLCFGSQCMVNQHSGDRVSPFLVKLDANANAAWIKTTSGNGNDAIMALRADKHFNVYLIASIYDDTLTGANIMLDTFQLNYNWVPWRYYYYLARLGHETAPGPLAVGGQTHDVLSLYPNPAEKYIKIRYAGSSKVAVRITDLQGRCVLQTVLNNSAEELTEDVSMLPRGFYLVRIETASELRYARLVLK